MTEGITAREFLESEGVEDWRVVGDGMTAFFPTARFDEAVRFVQAIGELEAIEDHPPDVDIRPDGVTVRVITVADDWYGPTRQDVEVARAVSRAARDGGLVSDPSRVQSILLIPGSRNPAEVMPFWQAVLDYQRRPDNPGEDLIDPRGRGPALWFEAMDEPRSDGGGAVHVAVWLPYEQAEARVAAALEAGGRMVRDQYAPMWWTLADAAGNEVDVSTPKERD